MPSSLESADGHALAATISNITARRQAEKQLAQTEVRYRALLEAAPDAMVVVHQNGRIKLLNARAEKQFGYSRGELLGQEVASIIPEGFAERLMTDRLRPPAEALAQQIGSGIQLHGRRKDGSDFPIEIMLSSLDSSDGILVTAAIRDITARKESEQHLAHTEARYRGLLEAAPDAMVVVDQDDQIVLLNLRAELQFGYSRHELSGQKISSIIPVGFAERLVADSRRSASEALAQQIGTGIELYGRRKDGSDFPIEIMLSPLKSAEGVLVTAAIRDISARKAAEIRLAQTEARYRGLLEAAPDGMVVVNETGDIVLLNIRAEEQFGYPRDKLIGRKVTTIIPHGFAERLAADGLRSASEALEQQIGSSIELVGRRRAGSDFPIEIMLSPLQTAEGVLVTAAIRDITVRKADQRRLRDNVEEVRRSNAAEARLEELVIELNRSNEDLEQFANIASHDLQEPLRMVASFTQLLAKRYKGRLDPDADEFIAFAVDGATRMKHLIQDLLAYSRAGLPTTFIKISSQDVVRQALAQLANAIKQSGAKVTHGCLPGVRGDETQLVQLFEQIIGNAIKYQRPGTPLIHISAIPTGGRWKFSITDNGLGIDQQYTPKIFGMFQRLHGREFAGTGVGLAICKKIARRHGTDIHVDSYPGRGSTFSFCLHATEPSHNFRSGLPLEPASD